MVASAHALDAVCHAFVQQWPLTSVCVCVRPFAFVCVCVCVRLRASVAFDAFASSCVRASACVRLHSAACS